jgi:hypothetical protein
VAHHGQKPPIGDPLGDPVEQALMMVTLAAEFQGGGGAV